MVIKYQIFISSTYEDLKDEREQVIRATLEMGHIPVGMEMFSAGDEEQWKVIARQIDQSDYYVVIVAHRYGSLVENISFTEKEYNYAIEKGVPVLGFIIDGQAAWPPKRIDTDENLRTALDTFKEKVKRKPVGFWSNAEELYGKYSIALVKNINTNPRPGWARATEIANPEVTNELSRLSSENSNLRLQLEQTQHKNADDELSQRKKIIDILSKHKINVSLWKAGAKGWSDPVESTLFSLFRLIAPNLVVETSVEGMSNYVGMMHSQGAPIRSDWPVPSNSIQDWLSDLLALGLVKPSEKKHPVSDKGEYWTLTEEGLKVHAILRKVEIDYSVQEKGQVAKSSTPESAQKSPAKKPSAKKR